MSKVLIVEDNPVNRELLREILEICQYEVEEASDGPEALEKINQTKPEVVLLDINMPGMDGYAVLGQIRQNPAFRHLPVLAVTAYAMKGDREKILGAGFNGYLSKPIDSGQLLIELRRFELARN